MKPARFDYHLAGSVEDALDILARHGDEARPIAGGQSLAPMLNMRVVQPGILVDLNRVPDLAFVRREGDVVTIGAMTRHHDVAHDPVLRECVPLLAHAAGTIGHYAIRQRGTLGGSLAHADPAAQLPAVALALGAEMEIASPAGPRREPAERFFVSTFETRLAPGELLVAIRFPVARAGEGWGFHLFARRAGDYAIALAAARLRDGEAHLAFAGVGGVPLRRRVPTRHDATWAEEAGRAEAASLILDDAPGVPAEYRREIAAIVAERALADALRRSRAGA